MFNCIHCVIATDLVKRCYVNTYVAIDMEVLEVLSMEVLSMQYPAY